MDTSLGVTTGDMMDDKLWEKLAALGGVVFVVLNVVGTIAQGAPPAAGDTNDEVLAWFADNESGIKIAAFLGALSIIGLVWWFGSLWRRMSRAEQGNHRLSIVALVGLAGSATLFAASTAVLATIAIQVDEVGADGARFFYVLSMVLLAMASAFVVTHLAAVNALSLRTALLPKWVTWLGLVSAAVFLVSTLGSTTDADAIVVFGFIGFITWAIWLLAVAVHMWRTADAN